MKKIIAVVLTLAVVAGCMFAFAACGKTDEETTVTQATSEADAAGTTENESDLEYVKSKGKLVVGITDFAPMDYKDSTVGTEWIGFDADMAKEFAKKLGVEVEFIEIDWNSKTMELDAKNIDCVWNGMTLTDEVTSAMSCTQAYCKNAQVIVVPAANAEDYKTEEACKDLQFAVEAGSAGESVAKEKGFANITPVQDQATALQEVAARTADASIIDLLMAAAMVGEGTGFENLTYTVSLNSEEYGVGFRKGSDLTAELNAFFDECKADGTLQKIAETYGVQDAVIK